MSGPTDPHLVLSTSFQDAAGLGVHRTIGMYTTDGQTCRIVIDFSDDTTHTNYSTLRDPLGTKPLELVGVQASIDVVSSAHIMRYRVISGTSAVVVWVDAEADPVGATGATGATGARGPDGAAGAAGAPGLVASGNATLSSGAATVSRGTITSGAKILLSRKTQGSAPGHLSYALSAGVNFSISSSSNTDDGIVTWGVIVD